MKKKAMSLLTKKIGRNDPCFCGSGKKYKKCCLDTRYESISEDEQSNAALLAEFQEKLIQKFPEKDLTIVDNYNSQHSDRMSEVILDFADELLQMTSNHKEMELTIILAIVAWNVTIAGGDIEETFEKFDSVFENKIPNEFRQLLQWLVEKKQKYYSEYDRSIVDFNITRKKGGIRLDVISAGKDEIRVSQQS